MVGQGTIEGLPQFVGTEIHLGHVQSLWTVPSSATGFVPTHDVLSTSVESRRREGRVRWIPEVRVETDQESPKLPADVPDVWDPRKTTFHPWVGEGGIGHRRHPRCGS